MRAFLSLLLVLAAAGAVSAARPEPLLILDEAVPLLHFRRADGPFAPAADPPSREGLESLRVSGSAQYSLPGFAELRRRLGSEGPLHVFDLRQESHGFVDGRPVSWYAPRDQGNMGLSPQLGAADELGRLRLLFLEAPIVAQRVTAKDQDVITATVPETLEGTSVSTEEDAVSGPGVVYHRVPVTDHYAPPPAMVARFEEAAAALSADAWMHFHCHGGDGRTTTFMAMADMRRNARRVSFEDILRRQHLLGGIDLANPGPATSWKHGPAAERLEFLRAYYRKWR